MDRAARRASLIAGLAELDAEAFLVTRLPNVRYLTGFAGSNGQVLLGPDAAILLTDGRYEEAARREAPDVERSISGGRLAEAVGEACDRLGATRVAFEADGLTYRAWSSLRDAGLDLVPATGAVERLRRVKDAEEISLIAAAQAIADDGFDAITGKLAEGATEREVAFELESFLRQRTPDGLAFPSIVAFGESAAEPHHHPTDRPLSRGDIVKMDFGCVVEGYHSDMTRTVAFGEPAARLREVYEVVRAAQHAGVEAVRAGVRAGELDDAVRSMIADAGYGPAFTHPLGHGVGLEIHEDPVLRAGSEEVVPAGAVITIEPGVYLSGVGGVRIEDMVEVTEDGGRVLPRTAKDLVVL